MTLCPIHLSTYHEVSKRVTFLAASLALAGWLSEAAQAAVRAAGHGPKMTHFGQSAQGDFLAQGARAAAETMPA